MHMLIISIEKRASGVHALESHSWMTDPAQVPEGFLPVPEALRDKAWETLGYCDLLIQDGAVTDIVPLERPVDYDALRAAKLAEIAADCSARIYAGIELNGARYSLTEHDQTEIMAQLAAVKDGAASVFYHADGELCREYPAGEFAMVANAAAAHIFYHRTLCNHLNAWIRRAETEKLTAICYGAALPDDLATHMEEVLTRAQAL